MFTIAFWKDAGERVAEATLSGALGVVVASGDHVFDLSWRSVVGAAIGAGAVALKATLGSRRGDPNTGSFLSGE